jgi:hypothetical protein
MELYDQPKLNLGLRFCSSAGPWDMAITMLVHYDESIVQEAELKV